MSIGNHTFRDVKGERIPGTWLQAFIHNNHYYAVEIKVYRDGMVDCWGLVTFEQFKAKVRQGWVVTQLPEGARVGVMISGMFFNAVNVRSSVEPEEFIKEVADEIRILNGEPDTLKLGREALQAYYAAPGASAKAALRAAYEAVPKHRRMYLGDMDSKDHEYQIILGE